MKELTGIGKYSRKHNFEIEETASEDRETSVWLGRSQGQSGVGKQRKQRACCSPPLRIAHHIPLPTAADIEYPLKERIPPGGDEGQGLAVLLCEQHKGLLLAIRDTSTFGFPPVTNVSDLLPHHSPGMGALSDRSLHGLFNDGPHGPTNAF